MIRVKQGIARTEKSRIRAIDISQDIRSGIVTLCCRGLELESELLVTSAGFNIDRRRATPRYRVLFREVRCKIAIGRPPLAAKARHDDQVGDIRRGGVIETRLDEGDIDHPIAGKIARRQAGHRRE